MRVTRAHWPYTEGGAAGEAHCYSVIRRGSQSAIALKYSHIRMYRGDVINAANPVVLNGECALHPRGRELRTGPGPAASALGGVGAPRPLWELLLGDPWPPGQTDGGGVTRPSAGIQTGAILLTNGEHALGGCSAAEQPSSPGVPGLYSERLSASPPDEDVSEEEEEE
ncbi:hypothetical protein SKAU_G00160080 [Synaphobranchus kaupii]|uniref:Uncharacterized protein n=1 Tax=Synaphobranchus kaupii TaxID=118154 RepID=A0A9Q1FIB9_SYNKA|nr:hypothetical protein SKAU_G00160080 [Synaphobranchus kaupii]